MKAHSKIWYQALRSQAGIRVASDDLVLLKAQLYKVRRDLNDQDLYKLEIRLSPKAPDKEIWIVHKEIIHAKV